MEKQKTLHKEKTSKPLKIKLRLTSVKILSFSIKNELRIKEDNNMVFEIGVTNNTNLNKSSIEIIILVKIFLDKTKKIELGEVKTSNIFEVMNLKKHIRVEDKKNTLPEVLLASIVGISISNTRGILIAKAAGTVLSNAVIPVINPSELIRSLPN